MSHIFSHILTPSPLPPHCHQPRVHADTIWWSKSREKNTETSNLDNVMILLLALTPSLELDLSVVVVPQCEDILLCYYNYYGHSHFPCRVKRKDLTLRKKLSFPLRISAVNVTKAARNCGFGHIDHRNP